MARCHELFIINVYSVVAKPQLQKDEHVYNSSAVGSDQRVRIVVYNKKPWLVNCNPLMYCIMNQAEIKAILERIALGSHQATKEPTPPSFRTFRLPLHNNIDMLIPPETVFSVSFKAVTLRCVPRHRGYERKRESEPIA